MAQDLHHNPCGQGINPFERSPGAFTIISGAVITAFKITSLTVSTKIIQSERSEL
jgi:hypothetical protein